MPQEYNYGNLEVKKPGPISYSYGALESAPPALDPPPARPERPYIPPTGPGQRGSTNRRDPVTTVPQRTPYNLDPINQILGTANRGVEILQAPARFVKEKIAEMSDETASTVGRIATAGIPGLNLLKIGRASCRERV